MVMIPHTMPNIHAHPITAESFVFSDGITQGKATSLDKWYDSINNSTILEIEG